MTCAMETQRSNLIDLKLRLGVKKIHATAAEAFETILNDVCKLPVPFDFIPASFGDLRASMDAGPRGLIAVDVANIEADTVDGKPSTARVTYKAWSHLVDREVNLDTLPPYLTVVVQPSGEAARILPHVPVQTVLEVAVDHRAYSSQLVCQENENADELYVVLSTLRWFAEKGTPLGWSSTSPFKMFYTFMVDGWLPEPHSSAVVEVSINWMEGFDYHRRINEVLDQHAHDHPTG